MADENNSGNEATAPATNAKPKTEYTAVTMEDGRVVQFAGSRQADKTVTLEADGTVSVSIDFRNGKSVRVNSSQLNAQTQAQALGHGLSQKIGDEYSGVKKVDDMHLAAEEMIKRLVAGDWSQAREAGDGFSGASIVIKAIVEATGKTVDQVKAFLNGKLEAAKAKGEKLTRADLYASFRNPASKTGVIIERLEREERSKASKVNADDLLAEVGAEG
jgi:hypothetical protein